MMIIIFDGVTVLTHEFNWRSTAIPNWTKQIFKYVVRNCIALGICWNINPKHQFYKSYLVMVNSVGTWRRQVFWLPMFQLWWSSLQQIIGTPITNSRSIWNLLEIINVKLKIERHSSTAITLWGECKISRGIQIAPVRTICTYIYILFGYEIVLVWSK